MKILETSDSWSNKSFMLLILELSFNLCTKSYFPIQFVIPILLLWLAPMNVIDWNMGLKPL